MIWRCGFRPCGRLWATRPISWDRGLSTCGRSASTSTTYGWGGSSEWPVPHSPRIRTARPTNSDWTFSFQMADKCGSTPDRSEPTRGGTAPMKWQSRDIQPGQVSWAATADQAASVSLGPTLRLPRMAWQCVRSQSSDRAVHSLFVRESNSGGSTPVPRSVVRELRVAAQPHSDTRWICSSGTQPSGSGTTGGPPFHAVGYPVIAPPSVGVGSRVPSIVIPELDAAAWADFRTSAGFTSEGRR